MKKYIIYIVGFLFFAGAGIAFATPSSIDRITDHIQPLIFTDYLKIGSAASSTFSTGLEAGRQIGAPYFNATSTTATSTFAGGLSTNLLSVTSTTATSTFSGGISVTGGGIKDSTLISCSGSNALNTDSAGVLTCGATSGGGTSGGGVGWATSTSAFLGSNESIFFYGKGAVGIGTSSPQNILTVSATSSLSNVTLFDVMAAPTLNGTSTAFRVLSNGNVGVGTSSPYAMLSIAGLTVADSFNATNTAATSTLAGNFVAGNNAVVTSQGTGSTSISNLNTGLLTFDNDSGAVTFVDLPTLSATNNTVESYTQSLAGIPILTIFGQATGGANGIKKTAVGIGTTSPFALFSIQNNGYDNLASSTAYSIYVASTSPAGSGIATTTHFALANTGQLFLPSLTQSAANQTYYACGAATTFEMLWDTTTCLVSALKFKKDIVPITSSDALDTVLGMKPVTYLKKVPLNKTDAGRQSGFIADWTDKKVAEELVTYDNNGDIHGFRYEQYTAYLTGAIQALNTKIKTATRSTEENWQWGVIFLMALWIIRLEIKTKK